MFKHPDITEFILRFHVLCFSFCSLQGLIYGHVLPFCPFCPPHLYVNSLCVSGLGRLLHQPAVGLRRVPGRGPRGSEEGSRQTGPRHARESKGQGLAVASPSVMRGVSLIIVVMHNLHISAECFDTGALLHQCQGDAELGVLGEPPSVY